MDILFTTISRSTVDSLVTMMEGALEIVSVHLTNLINFKGFMWISDKDKVASVTSLSYNTKSLFIDFRIYVDAVINHMVGAGSEGTGTGGSYFNGNSLDFPGVPFGPNDFNCCQCAMCTTGSCDIENYHDVDQVKVFTFYE